MKKQFLALATIFTLGAGAFAPSTFAAEHKIQKGETLADISKQYSMTVEDLKKLNNLSSDLIFANETLNVLGDSDFYTIQPGDTLHEIGLAKKATVDQLMKWNNLSSDLIYAGDTLAVTPEAGKVRMEEQKKAVTSNNAAAQQQPQQQAKQQQPKQQVQQKAQQKTQQQASKPAAKQQAQATQAPAASSKTLTMVATAYTAYCSGCSGITANGTDLRANPGLKVIAVDPKVIPLGTKVWVEGYGEAIAADTGGAIKGNKIDLFMPNKSDAYSWGRRTVQVKILN